MANGIVDKIGIYAIYNKLTGECIYVGSGGLRNRESTHLGLLRHNKHKNKLLQAVYNEIGEENFENRILEECTEEDKTEVETKYWKMLNPSCCLEKPKPAPRYKDNYPKMSAAQRGENNPRAVKSDEEIAVIRDYINSGLYQDKYIAKLFGISLGYVSALRHNKKRKKDVSFGEVTSSCNVALDTLTSANA
jgi:hypothetical protein